MKNAIPLVLCTFTLTGCLTVSVPEAETELPTEPEPIISPVDDIETPPDVPVNNDQNPDNNDDSPSVNSAPIITGTPITSLMIDTYYSFTPTASDAEEDHLTFAITNKPDWANFSTTTGELSGFSDNLNSYTSIVISVADESHTTSLTAFDINTLLPNPLEITIRWQAPTEDTNDQPISDLDGFKIYYGTSNGDFENTMTINNGDATQANIGNLSPGGYYFTLAALTSNGTESAHSNEFYFQVGQ
jgi:hypothetical protein